MTMAAKQKATFNYVCETIATRILPVPKDNSHVRFAEQISSIVPPADYSTIG